MGLPIVTAKWGTRFIVEYRNDWSIPAAEDGVQIVFRPFCGMKLDRSGPVSAWPLAIAVDAGPMQIQLWEGAVLRCAGNIFRLRCLRQALTSQMWTSGGFGFRAVSMRTFLRSVHPQGGFVGFVGVFLGQIQKI